MRKNVYFRIMIVLFLSLLISGCSISSTDAPPSKIPPLDNPKEEIEKSEDGFNDVLKPLTIEKGTFEKVYGWLDDQTILYSYVHAGNYFLESYNLYTKEQEIIFTTEEPIMNVLIHKHTENLFIHTSPRAHAGKLYFIDFTGNVYFTTEIDSYELAYEWNETEPSLMLVTAFFEDWSYKVHLINNETGKVEEVEDTQPFLKWYGDKYILEQDWQEDELAFFAPIIKKSLLKTTEPKQVFEKVFRFDIFAHNIMTIKVEDKNEDEIKYSFYDLKLKENFSVAFPNLTQYSDWFIPYYTFNEKTKTFLTFAPKEHNSVDHYNEGYELVGVDLNHHKTTVLFKHLENKPILCSKEGDLCLYGYQYEQLLNIKTGKQFRLVNSSI
ncbi:YqgU-like beta propeller domain-containing protein [Lederbergia panacisoli]|uniref:YqgU-like beta propeller domain-containing protein n=1 Tax=Lederbergia panacisoli TaxID=1255251 RepID=UPI00214C03DE|nr:hypothetical protein [Lederbergia panacisoli]MCR2820390.1 hypothetical protein [Lederbergia panacisoli]